MAERDTKHLFRLSTGQWIALPDIRIVNALKKDDDGNHFFIIQIIDEPILISQDNNILNTKDETDAKSIIDGYNNLLAAWDEYLEEQFAELNDDDDE